MPYKFLEDVAIADVAFEATGKTLKELFESAALAITSTQVKDLKSVEHKVEKDIEVESDNIEMLLFNFLQELIFYKDAELLLFSKFDLEIFPENKKWKLKSKAYGEKLDMKKHELLVDVKAVSLHQFKVEETKEGWKANVIIDV
ncbi:MAG: archease [Candidatus Aenigmatarchaeota archaeon]|nr:archease [Candidatus Aenigmarchaeota archaeon]